MLWASADPGCGKSVLSKALVDESLIGSGSGNTSTSYFFFKDDDDNKQSGANALCAILHQLFIQQPLLIKHAMEKFEQEGECLRRSFGTLWGILMKVAQNPEAGEIVCVLDALDECESSARTALIQKLGDYHSAKHRVDTRLKFIVTSRPYSYIRRAFCLNVDDLSSISLSGEEESEKISREIDLVIDDQIPRILKAFEHPAKPEVQKELVEHLKSMTHRTYLWLHLIKDVIQNSLETSKGRLMSLVHKVPDTVNKAYESILNQAKDQNQATAKTLLHIIVAAVRPLTLREMNIALAIEEKSRNGEDCKSIDDLELDEEKPFRNKIRNICGLFVSIADERIYLIHQTAKEFLVCKGIGRESQKVASYPWIWKHSLKPPESHLVLASICITYLSFAFLENDPLTAEFVDSVYHKRNPGTTTATILQYTYQHEFLGYAARHMDTHCREAPIQDSALLRLIHICEPQSMPFRTWFGICWAENKLFRVHQVCPSFSLLHAACYLGFEPIVRLLLQDPVNINVEDGSGQTALHWAIRHRYEAIVRLMLEANADTGLRNGYGEAALHVAVECGNIPVIKQLLNSKADVNQKKTFGETALHIAVGTQHKAEITEAIVKVLLEAKADINARDQEGRTALHQAAQRGCTGSVKLLLQAKADVDLQNDYGETVLHYAVKRENEPTVQLLLEAKPDVNARYQCGGTALHRAVQEKCIGLIKLLLQAKTDVNIQDNEGRTALHWAVRIDCIGLISLTLHAMIGASTRDEEGKTALLNALGYEAIVRLLLESKSEVGIQDNWGYTALFWAAFRNHRAVVMLLLEAGQENDVIFPDSDMTLAKEVLAESEKKHPRGLKRKRSYEDNSDGKDSFEVEDDLHTEGSSDSQEFEDEGNRCWRYPRHRQRGYPIQLAF